MMIKHCSAIIVVHVYQCSLQFQFLVNFELHVFKLILSLLCSCLKQLQLYLLYLWIRRKKTHKWTSWESFPKKGRMLGTVRLSISFISTDLSTTSKKALYQLHFFVILLECVWQTIGNSQFHQRLSLWLVTFNCGLRYF